MHAASRIKKPVGASAAVAMEDGDRHVMINATFVRIMITVTIAIVLAMTALIFYRSQSVVEPTAAIIISGDKYEQGSKIVVKEYDSMTSADGREVATATLTGENENVMPVLVEPGEFHVVVTSPDGQTLADTRVRTFFMRSTPISLPTSVVVIGNSSLSDAQIAVSSLDGRQDRVVTHLSAENDYRAVVYRYPGRTQITVTQGGKVLKDQQFEVDRPAGPGRPKPILFQLAPRYTSEEADNTPSE